MKTHDFIAQLVADSQAVAPVRIHLMFTHAVLLASVVSGAMLLVFWGIDLRIVSLMETPAFWVKLGLMLWLCASAWAMVLRLARPGESAGPMVWSAGASMTGLLAITISPFAPGSPEEQHMLTQAAPWVLAGVDHGWAGTAQVWQAVWRAAASISALALPWLAALLWTLRSMAPTQPGWAGASAGFMAGALSALLYSLHASVSAGPFETLGYLLGMALMPTIGALLGRRLLRW
ncbi:Anti-sigma-F factor NrsF [Burkholderiaceae bacterium]